MAVERPPQIEATAIATLAAPAAQTREARKLASSENLPNRDARADDDDDDDDDDLRRVRPNACNHDADNFRTWFSPLLSYAHISGRRVRARVRLQAAAALLVDGGS